jgi:uncharacterized membrane protein
MMFDKERRKAATKSVVARLLQFFLQGLIVIAPIGITIWVVLSLFNTVDNLLPNLLHSILPKLIEKDADGNLQKLPGLGFVVVIGMVITIGWLSSSFVVGKLVDLLDTILERTPGIKFIYTSVKDFFEAFAGNKKKFDKPVLVNVNGDDTWRMGFITQSSLKQFGLENHVAVYIPYSYAISGVTYFVPQTKVKLLSNISGADAMKFAISGGVTEV